ncbi:polysaccharide deacetylase family protein [Modestobacter sp. I12A-02628]|uniref:Polysaccharide deacetylase family protein n=1 Tax=Goekera deserti TaxID=2497753 RepID=A0A7K3W9L3_9ACTN|nr:polysaccharide deacetylase family protein [Goekera deserti]MPQ98846.1 polysaccharide deacetylase family protein [Goekera deserti]NDI49655.1 polysaccharide deacetylase family protein [Goekera deserti]NEL53152.1 polysaccharide deacetylase family protein [Goekera deserti]
MSTRRQFLLGAGTGVAGLAVGAAAGAFAADQDDRVRAHATAAAQARFGEAGGAADDGEQVARYGTRRVVWSATVDQQVAAITFDDGPTPEFTPRILDALDRAGVSATFNVMGWNGVHHPEVLRDVLAAGHEIGNHTWTHRDLTTLTAAQTRDELVRCKDEVEALTGRPFTSFRPPRGELTGYALRVAAELGYDTYIWSVTRGPGDRREVAEVAAYMGSTVVAGDVLGLHDGIGQGTFDPDAAFARALSDRRELEVRALPEALSRIADRGIRLVGADQLLTLARPEPVGGG